MAIDPQQLMMLIQQLSGKGQPPGAGGMPGAPNPLAALLAQHAAGPAGPPMGGPPSGGPPQGEPDGDEPHKPQVKRRVPGKPAAKPSPFGK